MNQHNEPKNRLVKPKQKSKAGFMLRGGGGEGVNWERGDGGKHCAKKGLMYQDVYRSNAAYKGVIEISK